MELVLWGYRVRCLALGVTFQQNPTSGGSGCPSEPDPKEKISAARQKKLRALASLSLPTTPLCFLR
eukprot:5310297-Amphidinium_carterae.1